MILLFDRLTFMFELVKLLGHVNPGLLLLLLAHSINNIVYLLCSSRMRSEGFSFNSGGLGVLFATRCLSVRNRPQPFATVRGRALRRCHWGKLLERVSDGNVTCQIRVK